MTAIQLREELFREMNPMLDSEAAMKRILAFVRSLSRARNTKVEAMVEKPYNKKWSGCASFTEDEIEGDPRLKALLSR